MAVYKSGPFERDPEMYTATAGCTPTGKPGNVRIQLTEMHGAVEALIKSFEELRDRLKPGLYPADPPTTAEAVPVNNSGSPLANELWQVVQDLTLLRIGLDYLRERVDL